MIAVWEVRPPDSRARALTFCKSMVAKVDGLKSWPTTMRSFGNAVQLKWFVPRQIQQDALNYILDVAHAFAEIFFIE